MGYLIFFAIFLFIVFWLSKNIKTLKNKTKAGGDRRNNYNHRPSLINVDRINEDENGLSMLISVDVFYELSCFFLRNGSPWVDVVDRKDGSNSSYNVNTSRWKGDGCPVMPEYQRKLTNFLKTEWRNAWEDFGKPQYISYRKKPSTPPESVDFSKRLIQLAYKNGALSGLPTNHIFKSQSGNTYMLSLRELYCTCPDFVKRRSHFPFNDLRRMCKHQSRTLIDIKKNTKTTSDKIIQALVRVSAGINQGIPLFSKFYEITINEKIKGPSSFHVMLPDQDFLWAGVLFFSKRSYTKFNYHIFEKRWGRHTNPFPAGSRQKYNWVMAKITDDL